MASYATQSEELAGPYVDEHGSECAVNISSPSDSLPESVSVTLLQERNKRDHPGIISWQWAAQVDNPRQQQQSDRRANTSLATSFRNQRHTYPPRAWSQKHSKKRHSLPIKNRQRHGLATRLSYFSNNTLPSSHSIQLSTSLHHIKDDTNVVHDNNVVYSNSSIMSSMISCHCCQQQDNSVKRCHWTETSPLPADTLVGDSKFPQPPPVAQPPDCVSDHLPSLLHSPTVSSIESTPPPFTHPPEQPSQFSAFWIDAEGQWGKRYVSVDENHVVSITNSRPDALMPEKVIVWYQRHVLPAQGLLLMSGFVFFPLWWMGAWLYRRHTTTALRRNTDSLSSSTETIQMIGRVNCFMSGLSILIMLIIAAMAAWLMVSY